MEKIKKYNIFLESNYSNSDLEEIKDILNDISDDDDVLVKVDYLYGRFRITMEPEKIRHTFRINQNIKSSIQRLDNLFKDEFDFLYQYRQPYGGWIKFYVYDDERGLRDYNTVRMDGSGKFPIPDISEIRINMYRKIRINV